MMVMVASEMSKTEYDLKAITYPAYDTPHKLCNIRGNSYMLASENAVNNSR